VRPKKLQPQLQVVGTSDPDEPPDKGGPKIRGPVILEFPTPRSGRIYWIMRSHYLSQYGKQIH
jgi:hypothetical protein